MRILLALTVLAVVALASACDDKSLCPFPNATPVEIAPPQPCIGANVETCIDPTLVVKNGCSTALYLPTAYGRFGPDGSIGDDIEVLPNQTAHFVVKPEKVKSQTSSRKDFVIPARLTTNPIEIRFSTLAQE